MADQMQIYAIALINYITIMFISRVAVTIIFIILVYSLTHYSDTIIQEHSSLRSGKIDQSPGKAKKEFHLLSSFLKKKFYVNAHH